MQNVKKDWGGLGLQVT